MLSMKAGLSSASVSSLNRKPASLQNARAARNLSLLSAHCSFSSARGLIS